MQQRRFVNRKSQIQQNESSVSGSQENDILVSSSNADQEVQRQRSVVRGTSANKYQSSESEGDEGDFYLGEEESGYRQELKHSQISSTIHQSTLKDR